MTTSAQVNPGSAPMAEFAALSWLGMTVHNAVELPSLTLLNPEVGLPTLVFILLIAGWRLPPYKRGMAALLFAWALLQLLGGGILSVIPFSFLPFYPEQSPGHYLAHLIYSVAQLPLLALSFRLMRPRQ